jgi:hypothetical protein
VETGMGRPVTIRTSPIDPTKNRRRTYLPRLRFRCSATLGANQTIDKLCVPRLTILKAAAKRNNNILFYTSKSA